MAAYERVIAGTTNHVLSSLSPANDPPAYWGGPENVVGSDASTKFN